MDEISFSTHVAADGTTTVAVVDHPDKVLIIPPDVPTLERDARIVAWVAERQAEAGAA